MLRARDEIFWRDRLKFFIERHPDFRGADEVYIPKDDLDIAFLFEGGVRVVGNQKTLSINFNDRDLAILWTRDESLEHIYRIPWSRLIGFDLVSASGPDSQPVRRAELIMFPGGKRT